MKNSFSLLFALQLVFTSGWTQINAQQSCIDSLKSYGVSLDQTDIQWLSDSLAFCQMVNSWIREDSSAFTISSAQTLIKLESNNLMYLTSDQLDANDELLTRIIHGSLIEHGLGEQTQLSAISWYQIFATQGKE